MRAQQLESIKWTGTESSNVNATYFDEHTQTICVRFNNKSLYSYIGGNEEIYMSLIHAPSVGKYLDRVLKALPYTRWDDEQALMHHLNA